MLRAVALAVGAYLFIPILLQTVIGALLIIGLGMAPTTMVLVHGFTTAKRRQVAEWTGWEVPDVRAPIDGPLRESLPATLRDPATYRALRWMGAYYLYGLLGFLVLPLWFIGLPVDGIRAGLLGRNAVVLPLIGRLADMDCSLSRLLLRPAPTARLAERVAELNKTRADAVAAHNAELRRIERDLHDGTQGHLVALTMRIGLAKRALADEPATTRRLLDEAQQLTEDALADLRYIVRGIHPPILTDRGLAGAVRALATGSGLDVTVDADDVAGEPRAPAAVESAAYFVVAESLTNAAKHSGSTRARVRLHRTARGLCVSVRDEGCGGVEEMLHTASSATGGTGMIGMRRRVAALDGTFTVTSPEGGPTVIEVELPCVW